ncbi:MAG TPA: rhodanese-like domain-containing protein [Candidatus Kapabacteria bacterium]|nr:rhodanese-like domain-containing protein [Candidatus Kapabacteria bacterium]
MGPFVPDIISNELNLIVALIIGFFFGFILEQAGFSSSRKLAGLFYGYDFTVLRVLFTAGVTAMIGIIVLSFLGIVDWNMLFINPTFRYSAIIGGIIMGAGFIIGGYCPGTSFAGASIGKIDAIVFIVGGILGVFVFAELYPYFKDIYLGFDYGELRIDKLLNVNPGIIALGFTLMAFVAFIITSKIERKVNNISTHSKKFFELPENKPLLFGFAFIAVSLILTFLPTREVYLQNKIEGIVQDKGIRQIDPLEFAFRVIDEDNSLLVVDLRDRSDKRYKTIPGSKQIPFDELFYRENQNFIKKIPKTIVFVDGQGILSSKAVAFANEIGNHRTVALRGGLEGFWAQFQNKPKEINQNDLHQVAYLNFITSAPEKLQMLETKYSRSGQSTDAKPKKKSGGC